MCKWRKSVLVYKNRLASQPTLSRFFNRMDEDTLLQFDDIDKSLRDIIYSIKCPEHIFVATVDSHRPNFIKPVR